jgi:hypothetical protein
VVERRLDVQALLLGEKDKVVAPQVCLLPLVVLQVFPLAVLQEYQQVMALLQLRERAEE